MAIITDVADNVGRILNGTSGETNTISGLGGNDTINGAGLIDIIFGGTGSDRITTSTGADRVWFQHDAFGSTNYGNDVWLDMSLAEGDKIDVSDLGESAGSGGSLGIGEFDTVKAMLSTVFFSGGSYVQMRWGTSTLAMESVATISALGAANFAFGLNNFADVFVLGNNANILATNLGNDFLDGAGGNDTLFGEQDNDTVLGGTGADSVFGGSGSDVVWGDEGTDTLYGGNGLDTLVAGGGFDQVFGGAQADHFKMQHGALTGTSNTGGRWNDFALVQGDRIDVANLGGADSSQFNVGVGEVETILAMDAALAGGGRSILWGGSRLDLPTISTLTAAMFIFNTTTTANTISLNAGGNLIAVGGGNDTLNGNGGNDTLFGEQGNDQLSGGTGIDRLYGGSGLDDLSGDADTDYLYGGSGNDVLNGVAVFDAAQILNHDQLYGGDGNDTYFLNLAYANAAKTLTTTATTITETATGGTDTIRINVSLLTIGMDDEFVMAAGIENLVATGNRTLSLHGNSLGNTITALSDTLIIASGFGGDDLMTGANQDDLLSGGSGDDSLYGGGDGDILLGGNGLDQMEGGAGNDLFFHLFAGLDVMDGGIGTGDIVNFEDTTSAVTLNLSGATTANGTTAAGVIVRVRNIEDIYGSNFADRFTGDAQANHLRGRGGNDTLTGEGGADEFVLTGSGSATADTITDFVHGVDKIGLNQPDFGGVGVSLTAPEFQLGSAASQSDDRIIYDQTTGRLYYDADGTGSSAKQLIAILTSKPTLSLADFTVDTYEL